MGWRTQRKKKARTTQQNDARTTQQTIVCIATGPSLTQDDCEQIREAGLTTIVVNDAYRIAPWAHALYACDRSWWLVHHANVIQQFKGRLYSQHQDEKELPHLPNVQGLQGYDRRGLSTQPGVIHHGANSGYQAVNLAYHLGATRILLLGYDMGFSGNKRHFFGEHPAGLGQSSDYPELIQRFRSIKPADYGLEIINCTRTTALDAFPCQRLEQALEADRHFGHRAESQRAA
jgi:hypothetical protein